MVKSMQSNNRYMIICAKLKDPVFLVQLHFLQKLESGHIVNLRPDLGMS